MPLAYDPALYAHLDTLAPKAFVSLMEELAGTVGSPTHQPLQQLYVWSACCDNAYPGPFVVDFTWPERVLMSVFDRKPYAISAFAAALQLRDLDCFHTITATVTAGLAVLQGPCVATRWRISAKPPRGRELLRLAAQWRRPGIPSGRATAAPSSRAPNEQLAGQLELPVATPEAVYGPTWNTRGELLEFSAMWIEWGRLRLARLARDAPHKRIFRLDCSGRPVPLPDQTWECALQMQPSSAQAASDIELILGETRLAMKLRTQQPQSFSTAV